MAFKLALTSGVGTALTTVHTGAAAVDTTVIGLSVANIHTATVTCDVKIFKSGGTPEAFIIKGVIIPAGDSFIAVGGEQKVVLQTGDYIQVVSDVAASIDVSTSYLES